MTAAVGLFRYAMYRAELAVLEHLTGSLEISRAGAAEPFPRPRGPGAGQDTT